MVDEKSDRSPALELVSGGGQGAHTYPQLEDIVLRGMTARTEVGVLDQVCDVIVALEMAGVVEVAGRCHGPSSGTKGELSLLPSTGTPAADDEPHW